jgi:hypothetical protein
LELNDGKLFDMPLEMKGRLCITRSALDEQLRKYDLDTAKKNLTHYLGNVFKGMNAPGKPTPAAAAAQKRLESARQQKQTRTRSGFADTDLTRTSTASLQSWLAKLHLEKWRGDLEKEGFDQVIDLVSCLSEDPDYLDSFLTKIRMPPAKVNTLKAAIKRDPRYTAR